KLWGDALQALDIEIDGMPRARSGKRKFHFCQPARFESSPTRLQAIYLLERSAGPQHDDIRRVGGAEAARLLSNEIYRRPIGYHLGRKVALLSDALRVAAVTPVFRLPVRSDLSRLDAAAARVENHHRTNTGNQNNAPVKLLST